MFNKIAFGGLKRKFGAVDSSNAAKAGPQKAFHGSIARSLTAPPKASSIQPGKPKAAPPWKASIKPSAKPAVRMWGAKNSTPSSSSSSGSSQGLKNQFQKFMQTMKKSMNDEFSGGTQKSQKKASSWGSDSKWARGGKKKRGGGKNSWNPEKAFKQEMEQMLKNQNLGAALTKVKSKLQTSGVAKEMLPKILELAAKKGGPAQYSEALSLLAQKNMPVDVVMFTKLLVFLTSRVPAPTGMVRLTLNLALPKDAQAVPLIPEGATEEEEQAVFEDGEPMGGQVDAPPPTTPVKELGPQPAMKDAAEIQEARAALSKVQPEKLRGLVQAQDRQVGAYFGHFTSLLHLEFIEELKALKRRLKRDYENLERFGWAVRELQVRDINVTQLSKNSNKGGLPGREGGTKRTRLRFDIPWNLELERLRMRPGDSVLLSRSDPLKDFQAEGIVDSAPTAAEDGLELDAEERRKPLVITVEGELAGKPEQIQAGTWRLDKAANRTAYERQFQALLRFAREKDEKRLPVWQVLPVTGVGGGNVDAWAKKMKDMLDEKQKASLEAGDAGASASSAIRPRGSVGGPLAGNVLGASAAKLKRVAEEDPSDNWTKKKLTATRGEILRDKSGLNQSQIKAVSSALGQRCTLIQGPPGTGKTHVSVRLLQLWAQKLQVRPLLATSDSNIAVDNIAEGLQQKGVKVIRLGRPEKVTSNLEECVLESRLKKDRMEAEEQRREEEGEDDEEETAGKGKFGSNGSKGKGFGSKGGKNGAKGSKAEGKWSAEEAKKRRVEDYEAKIAILKEADVICTTTIASGSGLLEHPSMRFGAILIDEVAQATELSAIVPLILRGAPRFVLVGDHCQLPPSVNSLEAETRGLSLSLFGRLAAQGLEPRFLDTQYRMHPAIADFSCQEFYYGKLKTGIDASDRPPPLGFDWPQEGSGIAFIHVDSWESRDGESRSNEMETKQLSQVLAKILAELELSVLEVGIVSPYSAQVRLLRQVLRRELPYQLRGTGVDLTGGLEGRRGARALEIASVDAFQGREKELIIFSAVRSNRHGAVGFLADWRRLNVMITRARRGLIVLGNFDTLRNDPTWEKWLNWASENGLVIRGDQRSQWGDKNGASTASNWKPDAGKWSSTSTTSADSWSNSGASSADGWNPKGKSKGKPKGDTSSSAGDGNSKGSRTSLSWNSKGGKSSTQDWNSKEASSHSAPNWASDSWSNTAGWDSSGSTSYKEEESSSGTSPAEASSWESPESSGWNGWSLEEPSSASSSGNHTGPDEAEQQPGADEAEENQWAEEAQEDPWPEQAEEAEENPYASTVQAAIDEAPEDPDTATDAYAASDQSDAWGATQQAPQASYGSTAAPKGGRSFQPYSAAQPGKGSPSVTLRPAAQVWKGAPNAALRPAAQSGKVGPRVVSGSPFTQHTAGKGYAKGAAKPSLPAPGAGATSPSKGLWAGQQPFRPMQTPNRYAMNYQR